MHKKHIKDKLIILKRFTVNENDLLVYAFGQNLGKITLKAKGGKLIKSKFIGKLEPLCIIDAEIYFSGKSYTLNNINLHSEAPISNDITVFDTSQKICLILYKTLPNEEPNKELFEYLISFIPLLILGKKSDELLTIFHIKYIELTGYLAETKNSEQLNHLSKNSLKAIRFYSQTKPIDSIRLVLPPNIKKEIDIHIKNLLESAFN